MVNYILGDTITRIRNGYLAKKKKVIVKKSNLILEFLQILYKEGYIKGFSYGVNYNLEIFLKYYNGKPIFNEILLISKPSKRIYKSVYRILRDYNLSHLIIISTSSGLITNRDLFFSLVNSDKKNNLDINFVNLVQNYKYNKSSIEFIYLKNNLNLNYFLNNLNFLNSLNRFFFFNDNMLIRKYFKKDNISVSFVNLKFQYYFNNLINFFIKYLVKKKNFKKYFSFYLNNYFYNNLDFESLGYFYKEPITLYRSYKLYKRLYFLNFIVKLNFLNFSLKINLLDNIGLKLNSKNLSLNYNKVFNVVQLKNLNLSYKKGGEILVSIL